MYIPDRFVILQINKEKEVIYKTFATWLGGYTTGDSWKLNSGNKSVTRNHDGTFNMEGYSGSTYIVDPRSYGVSFYTDGVLQQFLEKDYVVLLNEDEALKYLLDNSQET